MERNEMIKILMEKANINFDEAVEVLEKCNWDLLDAIIDLERRGKLRENKTAAIIDVEPEENYKKADNKNQDNKQEYNAKANTQEESNKHDEKSGGFGEVIGRMFKFIGRVVKKGNGNFFEVRKENEKPIRISLTISILLLIFFSVPSIILLVIGLFCGYKYSISGPNVNCDGVNDIFEEVSKSADTIKKDFKEGYEK